MTGVYIFWWVLFNSFFFFSDCPDFTGNKNAWEFDFIGLVFARRQHPGSVNVSLREA